MIVGTAGHIDHGKTALVKAITGVDGDRLPEEKARGVTIDLGFAYWPQPDGTVIGFVDAPGHQRFVHNMLAGVAGVDFALLVIAADDGVMPQTREHLEILSLLGVARGAVALTKIDLVSDERQAAAMAEVAQFLQGKPLQNAPIIGVSARTGEGVEQLKEQLRQAARDQPAHRTEGLFRLAVDRCFSITGAGTIVTGIAMSGLVRVGDAVIVSPAGLAARVRSLHAQGRAADIGQAGQRCALNLAGADITKQAITRGDMIVAPPLHAPAQRIDATLRWAGPARTQPRQGLAVRLHHGAGEIGVRLMFLSDAALTPGSDVYVQLACDRPLSGACGDRFILRDVSAARTLGGGRLLDLRAEPRRRRAPERLARLSALQIVEPQAALAALLALAPHCVELAGFARDRALPLETARRAAAELGAIPVAAGAALWVVSAPAWLTVRRAIETRLNEFHHAAPDEPGMGVERLRLAITPRLDALLLRAILAALAKSGQIALEGARARLTTHETRMSANALASAARIAALLGGATRFRPPRLRDLAAALGAQTPALARQLKAMARAGMVCEVVENHYFLTEVMAEIVGVAHDIALEKPGGGFVAADLRDALQTGRKMAIEILECFDRHGVTMRRGDLRRLNVHRLDYFG